MTQEKTIRNMHHKEHHSCYGGNPPKTTPEGEIRLFENSIIQFIEDILSQRTITCIFIFTTCFGNWFSGNHKSERSPLVFLLLLGKLDTETTMIKCCDVCNNFENQVPRKPTHNWEEATESRSANFAVPNDDVFPFITIDPFSNGPIHTISQLYQRMWIIVNLKNLRISLHRRDWNTVFPHHTN